MQFGVLGPLEVRADGHPVPLGGGKEALLLALLLLHAGETLSADRLIDALWGERPPPSAAKSVHVYVSHLRRALGDGRLVTRGRGYALEIEDDELDLDRFGRLVAEGRDLRFRGQPREAAAALSAALSLWRGVPLAGLEHEESVSVEMERLESLRLEAIEERIEVRLELGEAGTLVSELDALVREHPLREQLRGQLMLALYRCGRQAEALDVYREGRRQLAEELGLEPSRPLQDLEQAILRQDPALDAPLRAAARLSAAGRERRRAGIALALGGVVLLLAVAAASVMLTRGGAAGIDRISPSSVGAIAPGSSRIVANVPVAGGPSRLASNGRGLWVGGDDSGTVSAIAPASPAITRLVAVGGFPSDLAVGGGAVWVVDGKSGVLTKIDPPYGVVGRVRVTDPNPAYDKSREGPDPVSIAAGSESVWVTDGSHRLTRVDAATSKVTARFDLRRPLDGVALGRGSVWAISGPSATLFRLDRRTGRVAARIQIVSRPGFDSPYPLSVAVGEGWVWVLNGNTATVTKVDPVERAVSATIPIGVEHAPARLAVGNGAAWVANRDGTLSRIDAASNAVKTVPLGHPVRDVAVAAGRVWVTAGSGLSPIAEASPPVRDMHALPASFCSPIYYQGGQPPQYLIVADLPLQGFARALAAQAGEAVQFVLRQHRFRAGRFAVGYQACDNSTVGGGFSTRASCAASAQKYANDRSVIGVIGPLDSICARVEVPIANRAPGGALAMIAATNTYVGLTHSGPGAAPHEPERYYPTNVRNYARIIAADDVQAAADALLAKELGNRRIYVLEDPHSFGYDTGLADAFTHAARKLGLTIVGTGTWDYGHARPRLLAAQAHRLHAGTAFLAAGAVNDPRIGTFIAALHARGIRIIAPDAFASFDKLVQFAGPASEGVMVSVPGLPSEQLPKAGKAFVAEFGRAVGQTPGQFSVYEAQAALVMLDAIARSNGTRNSVRANLLTTKVSNGILGTFSIDRNGDTNAGAVTIYRIVGGNPKVARVLTPSPALVNR